MDMASGTYLKYLPLEVKQGRISMQQIDEMVRPILEVKIRMGLFENPYSDLSKIDSVLNAPESQQVSRRAAQRSLILLRNENNALPLDKSGKTIHSIAVIGPLGDATIDLLSMWGSNVEPGATVSVLQGIREKVGSAIKVEFAHGPNLRRTFASPFENIEFIKMKPQPAQTPEQAKQATEDAVALAQRSDLAVLVLGEDLNNTAPMLALALRQALGPRGGEIVSLGLDAWAARAREFDLFVMPMLVRPPGVGALYFATGAPTGRPDPAPAPVVAGMAAEPFVLMASYCSSKSCRLRRRTPAKGW